MIHSHISWPRSGDCGGSRIRTRDSCVLYLVTPSCFNQLSHHIPSITSTAGSIGIIGGTLSDLECHWGTCKLPQGYPTVDKVVSLGQTEWSLQNVVGYLCIFILKWGSGRVDWSYRHPQGYPTVHQVYCSVIWANWVILTVVSVSGANWIN
jgi:hypothetical protein